MVVVWSNDYTQQLSTMRNIKNRMEMIERSTVPATFIGTELPDQTDIDQVWENKGIGSAPAHSKVQWYDPTAQQIKNLMYQFDGAVAEPLQVPDENLSEIVDTFTVSEGDTPVTVWSNTDFPKDYRSVVAMGMVRTDNASVLRTLNVRYNNNTSSANWSYAEYFGNQVPAGQASGADNANNVLMGSVQSSTFAGVLPYTFSYFTFEIFYPYLAAPRGYFYNFTTGLADLTGVAATTGIQHKWGGGVFANSTVINNLSFSLNVGNFAVGSKIIVIGQNPR